MTKVKTSKKKASKSNGSKSSKQIASVVLQTIRKERTKQNTNSNVIRLKAASMLSDRGVSLVSAFKRALVNPFDPVVAGVKLPEPFPNHTSTYKVAGSIQLSAAAGVLSGAVYLRPNPFFSLLNSSQYVGLPQLTVGGSPIAFAGTTSAYQATSGTQIRNYRVVACGFKISCTQPWASREGNMYIAPIPTGKDTLSFNELNAVAALYANCASRLTDDIDTKSLASPQILELPGAMRFSLTELGNSCVILSDRPTSYEYASFYPTYEGTAINATAAVGSEISYVTSSGVVNGSASIPITISPGHTSYAVYFDQLPNAAQNIVNIEYIYHLEGSPTIAISGTNPVMVPSGPEMPTGKTSWESVISTVSKFGIGVADIVNEYGPDISRMYKGYNGNAGVGPLRIVGMN